MPLTSNWLPYTTGGVACATIPEPWGMAAWAAAATPTTTDCYCTAPKEVPDYGK